MKKAISIILTCVMLTLFVTACGGSGKEKDTGKTTDKSPKGDGIRTITVAIWADLYIPKEGVNDVNDLRVARIKEIEKKYNVKFNWKVVPQPEYLTSFINSTLAGDVWCDAFTANRTMLPTLVNNGIIAPLDDYVDFSNPVWDNQYKDIALWKGKRYGFVMENVHANYGVFYNKDIFNKDGLPDLYDLMVKGEWTYDKFRDIAIRATRDFDGDGINDQWGIANDMKYLADCAVFSNMGEYVKEDNGNYRFSLADKEGLDAIQFVYNLMHVDKVVGFEAAANLFKEGKAAMHVMPGWAGGDLKKSGMKNLGYVFFPKGPNATDYTSAVTGGRYCTIPSTVKDPGEVAKIVTEMFAIWDETLPVFMTFDDMSRSAAEGNMFSEEDVETYLNVQRKQRFVLPALFAPLDEIVLQEAFIPMQNAEATPASALEAIKLKAQSAIDEASAKK